MSNGIPFNKIDRTWTLFLDRDGVINVNKKESYVFNRNEFIWLPGVIEAIAYLRTIFGKIVVLTNQRGVSKGLMDEPALIDIHGFMAELLEASAAKLDAIYYCTHGDDTHPDRKPNTGMAMKAKEQFPEIDFMKSIMVGDKESDVLLGKNINAYTILISEGPDRSPETRADAIMFSLMELADIIRAAQKE